MGASDNEIMNMSGKDILQMVDETSKLVAKDSVNQFSSATAAAVQSNALTNNVEFWKWMGRNYNKSGIFSSNASMQQYISQGTGKEEWLVKQLQGKGFEWDWMKAQRGKLGNIFKRYDAGDIANRAASDITETNIITGHTTEYQLKAYTGKTNPHLNNTPKDMTVVTNAEKVDVVKANGYQNVEGFQDVQKIKQSTNERLEQIKNGKAQTSYNFKNVTCTMAKAGLIGCAVGMGTEAISSYKAWKAGELSDKEYTTEILKAGGDAGLTGAATAGIMIPVSAALTVAGASSILTFPIAIVVGSAVNKIIAPCFGRGEYKAILSEAKYYQNLDSMYDNLIMSMQRAAEQYYDFVSRMSQQNAVHQGMKRHSMDMNKDLESLYASI